jgi:hypothetical protein
MKNWLPVAVAVAFVLLSLVSCRLSADDTVSVKGEIARISQQIAVLQAKINYLTALDAAGVQIVSTPTQTVQLASATLNPDGTATVNGVLYAPIGACAAQSLGVTTVQIGAAPGQRFAPLRNLLTRLRARRGGSGAGVGASACQ